MPVVGTEPDLVDEQPWGSVVHFRDPDGNTWALQESSAADPAPSR